MMLDDELNAWIASTTSGAGPDDADARQFAAAAVSRLYARRRRRASFVWAFSAIGVTISLVAAARFGGVLAEGGASLTAGAARDPVTWFVCLVFIAWAVDAAFSPRRADA